MPRDADLLVPVLAVVGSPGGRRALAAVRRASRSAPVAAAERAESPSWEAAATALGLAESEWRADHLLQGCVVAACTVVAKEHQDGVIAHIVGPPSPLWGTVAAEEEAVAAAVSHGLWAVAEPAKGKRAAATGLVPFTGAQDLAALQAEALLEAGLGALAATPTERVVKILTVSDGGRQYHVA